MLEAARGRFRQRAGELGRVALGGDERVDGEGGGGAQNRAHVMRIGDLVEDQHEAVRGQVCDVDRRERPRLEQQSLMDGLARSPGGDFLQTHDPGLEPTRGDFGAEPLGRGGRGVEADQLAARRPERRHDAVKAIDERDPGLPSLAGAIAGGRAGGRPPRFQDLRSLSAGGGRRLA